MNPPTLPGRKIRAGCEECSPALYNNSPGRMHEGHFSVGLGDVMATVTIGGEKATNIREVLIDRDTHLALVWVYPEPIRRCQCVHRGALLELWDEVPGVVVTVRKPAP